MNDNSILLELTKACYNKVESEFLRDKYLQFLIHKYDSDLNPNEIFILITIKISDLSIYVVIAKQRQTLLSFFTSVIRDLQLKQLIG